MFMSAAGWGSAVTRMNEGGGWGGEDEMAMAEAEKDVTGKQCH